MNIKNLFITNGSNPFASQAILKTIESEVKDSLSLQKEFFLPTAATLINGSLELRESLAKTFQEKGGVLTGKFGDVAEDVQLYQGMAFATAFFAYNIDSGSYALYTANEYLLSIIPSSASLSANKLYEKNFERVVNAMRIDVVYDDASSFEAKAVRLTKKTELRVDEHIFVPLESVIIAIELISTLLASGYTLYSSQTLNGVAKDRFLSRDVRVLANYTDVKEFANSVSSLLVRRDALGGFYAPLVGATSDTLGLTRVDVLLLDKLFPVKDTGSLVESSVFEGSVKYVVLSLISNELNRVYSEGTLEAYNKYVEAYVDIIGHKNFLAAVKDIKEEKDMPEGAIVSLSALNRLVRDSSDEELQAYWDVLSSNISATNDSSPQELLNLISQSYTPVPTTTLGVESLKDMLKTGVYKVVVLTKKGTYSTVYVTNNEDLLSQAYGADYRARFESLGVRIRSAKHYLSEGELTWGEVMEYLGFHELVGMTPEHPKDNLAHFEELTTSVLNYKPRASTSNPNLVLGRRLFGTVGPKGVENYYVNIDMTRVQEVVQVFSENN